MSISFDRAVGFYDRTRGLPREAEARIADSIVELAHLRTDSRVLEIGIGTGRIALPLLERGYRVYGLDLSRAMMDELVKKAQPRGLETRLVQADSTRSPFTSGAFDGALAVHVLHLVAGWREALAELRRVVRPGGVLLLSWHKRQKDTVNVILRNKLSEYAAEYGVSTRRPGAASDDEILAELNAWGTRVQVVNVANWEESTTPAETLNDIDQQIHSSTWLVPRPVLDKVMPRLYEFARAEFGDLNAPSPEPETFNWIAAET